LKLPELLKSRKEHLARLSNKNGSEGELLSIQMTHNWIKRPKGKEMKNLLHVLHERQIHIKSTSFDAIHLPDEIEVNFKNVESIENAFPYMTFIEIKSGKQNRIKEDFSGFFFAITENEIKASEHLKDKYVVALFNKNTKDLLLTSIPEIIQRSRSSNWQVSVQL